MTLDPRERLIVALDVSSIAEAEAMVARLGEAVCFYKIGYQLAFAGGIDFARALAGAGKQIFLDLKLHDIGNTVARGVESVARLGASFLTVHAYPQTMHAAVDAREGSTCASSRSRCSPPMTTPTSPPAGYDFTVPELVAERAAQARDIGVDGLVCSAEEARRGARDPAARHGAGDAGHPPCRRRRRRPEARHDARRLPLWPGADYLVVGRPIIAARDPKAAAEAIVAEIVSAAGGQD